jgi:hypothetical protein
MALSPGSSGFSKTTDILEASQFPFQEQLFSGVPTCVECGYDLTASTAKVCPECGAAVREAVPLPLLPRPKLEFRRPSHRLEPLAFCVFFLCFALYGLIDQEARWWQRVASVVVGTLGATLELLRFLKLRRKTGQEGK